MDQAFVEQVTKLVLAKLEQVLSSELRADLAAASSTHGPLTQQELARWESISQSVNVFRAGCSAAVTAQAVYRPLSQDELKRWDEISCSINKAKNKAKDGATGHECATGGGGFIKIYQYG